MRANSTLSVAQLARLLKEHGIKRSREWVRVGPVGVCASSVRQLTNQLTRCTTVTMTRMQRRSTEALEAHPVLPLGPDGVFAAVALGVWRLRVTAASKARPNGAGAPLDVRERKRFSEVRR